MNCINRDNCPCTYVGCENHGHCCACVKRHRERNQVPACFFSKEAEATFNRSIENLAKDKGLL